MLLICDGPDKQNPGPSQETREGTGRNSLSGVAGTRRQMGAKPPILYRLYFDKFIYCPLL
jgi:hypothetical protein